MFQIHPDFLGVREALEALAVLEVLKALEARLSLSPPGVPAHLRFGQDNCKATTGSGMKRACPQQNWSRADVSTAN